MAIDRFNGEYRFLSNFYPARVCLDEHCYDTVEHAYQAAKTLDTNERMQVRLASSPARAKRLGRQVVKRDDWDDIKVNIMHDLLRQKFAIIGLRDRLLATVDAELVEGNDWHDTFWGVCNGVGDNKLGKLLMAVRAEIREGKVT